MLPKVAACHPNNSVALSVGIYSISAFLPIYERNFERVVLLRCKVYSLLCAVVWDICNTGFRINEGCIFDVWDYTVEVGGICRYDAHPRKGYLNVDVLNILTI